MNASSDTMNALHPTSPLAVWTILCGCGKRRRCFIPRNATIFDGVRRPQIEIVFEPNSFIHFLSMLFPSFCPYPHSKHHDQIVGMGQSRRSPLGGANHCKASGIEDRRSNWHARARKPSTMETCHEE